jgi:acetylornithine deacetylase/succinyl-diaminopimelate desuccinylase family protein
MIVQNSETKILSQLHSGNVVSLLQQLVRIRSDNPPCQLGEIASFVAKHLRAAGIKVQLEGDAGDGWERLNVIGTLKGAGGGPTLILAAHTDVVPPYDLSKWQVDPFAAEVVNGEIIARGTADTKGSLAAMMAAVEAIAASGVKLKGDLVLLAWAGDEATPLGARYFNGIAYLADNDRLKGDAMILGEPYDLKIVYLSRGRVWFEIEIGGEATHSATGKGINAIRKAMNLIEDIYTIKVGEHPVLGKDSINVGTIKGGTQPNIVPDSCTFTFDIRFGPPLSVGAVMGMVEEKIKQRQAADPQFVLKSLKVTEKREPLGFAADQPLNLALERAGKIALNVDLELGGALSFGDTADWKDRVGIKEACLFGPGKTKEAHAVNERIAVADLVAAAKVYALAASYYCGVAE